MSLRKKIKQDAKLFLQGRWAGAVASVLFWMFGLCFVAFLEMLADYLLALARLNGLFSDPLIQVYPSRLEIHPAFWILCGLTALSFFFLCPLEMGRAAFYMDITAGGKKGAQALFLCFTSPRLYFRGLWFGLQLTVRRTLWGILFFLPTFALWLVMEWIRRWNSNPWVVFSLGAAALLVGILSGILYLFFIQRYALVAYQATKALPEVSRTAVSADSSVPELPGCRKAFRLSRRIMKGRHTELFMAKLSFLPWFVFSLLALPALYVLPYYEMTLALYARYFSHRFFLSSYPPPSSGDEAEGRPAQTEPQRNSL